MASESVLGEDLLLAAGVDWKTCRGVIGEHPSARKVNADRKPADKS